MKAIQITAFGGPESMHLVDLAEPVPGPGQEVIEVTSTMPTLIKLKTLIYHLKNFH
jgi:NADPH:quinone reductase-like Zn-dependent oxidoreductase